MPFSDFNSLYNFFLAHYKDKQFDANGKYYYSDQHSFDNIVTVKIVSGAIYFYGTTPSTKFGNGEYSKYEIAIDKTTATNTITSVSIKSYQIM